MLAECQSMVLIKLAGPTRSLAACVQDHRIHMSESDFVNMTHNGALCNAAGEIGAQEFEKIMRGEVITYLQVMAGRHWQLPTRL